MHILENRRKYAVYVVTTLVNFNTIDLALRVFVDAKAALILFLVAGTASVFRNNEQ
jgi:hypothetical protein